MVTEEELLECLCGFVSDALQSEDVFDDLEQLEQAEPEGEGQFDFLHGGEQSLVGCGDEVEDGVVESRCLDLSADVMFMFLAHANNFFYVFFVISDEERQSVLQPWNVEESLDQLVVAVVVGQVPNFLFFDFVELVDKRLLDASLQDAADVALNEDDVLLKVVVHLHDVLELRIGIAHQEVDVEVVLPPEKLN